MEGVKQTRLKEDATCYCIDTHKTRKTELIQELTHISFGISLSFQTNQGHVRRGAH